MLPRCSGVGEILDANSVLEGVQLFVLAGWDTGARLGLLRPWARAGGAPMWRGLGAGQDGGWVKGRGRAWELLKARA